ncbi:MAG: cysteine--tRNA ligase [bacterium]|nr:cysteine--tRNA ligase [bacterium]
MITLYNTLTKTKEELIPRHPSNSSGQGKIQMFVCGPTVYDYIHIGNARTFVFFDVVAKYLRSQDYEVDYIQNITDIDDKIIQRARENNHEPLEYAKKYYEKFKEDIKALGVSSPRYISATEHINQVVKQVKTLIDKGFAYKIEGDGWYFDLSKFPEYGKLSGRKAQMADDAVSRIDENEQKRNRGDFCLWKFSKEGEPSWNFETGKAVPVFATASAVGSTESAFGQTKSAGRPGWHIEDTAITNHYFGPQYDIHGGGQDLMFPHHEAEIAQQESASGLKPFVKYWMHVAFLVNKDEKMSKSLGNFETVNNLLKKYPKETLRFYLLSGHYRQPLEFSDKILRQSQAGISRISEFVLKLKNVPTSQVGTFKEIDKYLSEAKEKFVQAMDNDFNTPEAFTSIFEMIKIINPYLAKNKMSKKQVEKVLGFLKETSNITGIIPSEQQKIPAEVLDLVDKREKLREEKNYDESDKIRARINDLGYEIEDTIYGSLVVKKL